MDTNSFIKFFSKLFFLETTCFSSVLVAGNSTASAGLALTPKLLEGCPRKGLLPLFQE